MLFLTEFLSFLGKDPLRLLFKSNFGEKNRKGGWRHDSQCPPERPGCLD